MKRPEDYKETYRLWVECLKENKDYKDYCEANPGRQGKTVEEIIKDGIERSISMSRGRNRLVLLESIYDVFGDVFSDTYDFEEWWNQRMLRLLELYKSSLYCINNLSQDINQCAQKIYALYTQGGQVVTVEKIKDLLNQNFGERSGIIPLQVFAYYQKTTLQKRFKQIIYDHKYQYNITAKHQVKLFSLIIPLPTVSSRYLKHIINYLERYRLKKKKTWKMIILEKNLTKYIGGRDSIKKVRLRELLTNNKNMKNIINYAAKGIFPKYK